jgi:outer membrane lipoprotein-sorting protein/thiol-disulfide isomerase/thioredoxin
VKPVVFGLGALLGAFAWAQDPAITPTTPQTATPKPLPEAAQLLVQMYDALSRRNSLSGKFQLTIPGEPTAIGTFRMLKPNMFEVLGVPVEVRSDGRDVWQFDPATQVFDKRAPKPGEYPYLVGYEAFFGAPPELRPISTAWVSLFRKEVVALNLEPGEGYQVRRLFVDPETKLPLGWSITDATGKQASLKVSELKVDEAFTAESFRWEPPRESRPTEQVELENQMITVGEIAPPVQFVRLDGQPFRMLDYLSRSRMTLVLFWHSDCPASKVAMPELQRWAMTYAGSELQTLSVNVGDNTSVWERTVREWGWRLPSVRADADSPAVSAMRIRAFPSIYLIDRENKVRGRWVGWNQRAVTNLLTGMKITPGKKN